MNEPKIQCANADCRVAVTGKCVEGLEPSRCPHFGKALPIVAAATTVQPRGAERVVEGVSLPNGERLAAPLASAVLRGGSARVMALIGPTGSGKTSLIASLYDMFQCGPVGRFHFTRSRTLRAFEQACHDARAASQRAVPHTERTLLGEVAFYHIGLQDGAMRSSCELLLADRAGEEYRSATDDPSVAKGFIEVRRADALTVLVDGHRLLDLETRHNLRSEVEMTFQAFVDGDAVTSGQRVALVLTKLDEIEMSAQKDRAERDFEGLVSSVRRLFGRILEEVAPFRVAASPATDVFPRGYGVADLLTFWTAASGIMLQTPLVRPRPARAMARITVIGG